MMEVIVGPSVLLVGIAILVRGMRRLFNLTGWWPNDRRGVLIGVPITILGGVLTWIGFFILFGALIFYG